MILCCMFKKTLNNSNMTQKDKRRHQFHTEVKIDSAKDRVVPKKEMVIDFFRVC
jgi:hypothetical protein